MSAVDTNLFVGPCPFRDVPSGVEALNRLREQAGLDRAIATGFNALLYYDPITGLDRDLEEYDSLSGWLDFFAVINPEFPRLEAQVQNAAGDRRIVGLRLFPTLHHFALNSERTLRMVRLAAEHRLPVNVTARVFDGRVAPPSILQTDWDRDDLAAFLSQAGEATVVLSMFFFNELKALDVDWEGLPNVYLDLGCSKPTSASFDELASWFPVDRVLFGTGAPFYYWKGSRLALEGAELTAEQKAAILGSNAKEVFQWA